MAERLRGKVAIVTGGSSGIGGATARLFLQEGASVLIADISEPSDEGLLDAIQAWPESAMYLKVDVSCASEVARAVTSAVEKWGQLNIAVSCAALPGQGGAVDLPEDQWDRIMDVNAKGVFLVSKYAIPAMLDAGGGSIINISSVYGIKGAPGFAAYGASKGAVRTLTKSTAIEFAARGIRVNSIHPGTIETPMLRGIFERSGNPEDTRRAFASQQPGGVIGRPEDIAWGCVYLASDEAAFVTGVEFPIDGGMLAV